MGQRGFTLLEVMFAVAILAIAFPVLLALRNWDVQLLDRARTLTAATLLAQEKLFETEVVGAVMVGEQTGDFAAPLAGVRLTELPSEGAAGFRWQRVVTPTPFEAIREVRIRVMWRTAGQKEDYVEVSSYVFHATHTPL